jgi:DNA-binding transcriptional ArsR family regulator
MQSEVQAIASIDRTIHEPARLAIVSVLSACESADFKALLTMTGLTKGNLSAQLKKLEEADYIKIKKSFKGRYSHTECAMTKSGRRAFRAYWQHVRALGAVIDLQG